MALKDNTIRELTIIGGIVALLLSVYLLTYCGVFVSDDEHLFVSAAQSLAETKTLTIPQLYGNERLRGIYENIEPAQAVLGAVFYKLALLFETGRVQTIFLLNLYVTAATGGIVYGMARQITQHNASAVVAALAFGFGTMAWPYAETLFRDSLASLFLSAAMLFLLLLLSEKREKIRINYYLGIVLCLGLGILTKNTILVAIPVIGGVLLLHIFRKGHDSQTARWELLGMLIIVGLFIAMVLLLPEGVFYRFSWPYYRIVLLERVFQPHTDLWQGIIGPLLSPGKGIFFYSPVLLLAVASLMVSWRAYWYVHILAWGTLLGLIMAQVLFYDHLWWGVVNWGLRYLVPALPMLVVAATPTIDALLLSDKRMDIWILVALLVVSALVQIGGIAVPLQAYYQAVAKVGERMIASPAIWHPRYSAIFWHWRLLFNGATINFAWARNLPVYPAATFLFLAAVVVTVVAILYQIVRTISGKFPPRKALILWVLTALLSLVMLKVYQSDPAYYSQRADYAASLAFVQEHLAPGDVVIVGDYNEPLWLFTLNHGQVSAPWYSFVDIESAVFLSSAEEQDLIQHNLDLLADLKNQSKRIWLIYDLNAERSVQRTETEWLQANSHASTSWVFSGTHGRTKVTWSQ